MLFVIVLSWCIAPLFAFVEQGTCGKQKVDTVSLIHHGTASNLGDWPWHVAIYRTIYNKKDYICGGSIIDQNSILTGAHCFSLGIQTLSEKAISVHVGQVDLDEQLDPSQVFSVAKISSHPLFNASAGVEHDIAILKLSSDIIMTRFVQPVCLWSSEDDLGSIQGRNGTVVGFGLNQRDEYARILQKATLTAVDFQTCLANDRATHGEVLTHNMFCAGTTNGTSPCNGDSGGGMVFDKNGTWYVRGIVSFISARTNTTLCNPFKYTVFTDVANYKEWILTTIDKPRSRTQLPPCQNDLIPQEAICNLANRSAENFLLVGLNETIVRVPFDGERNFTGFYSNNLFAIDHDCSEGRVYWSTLDGVLLSAKYDGTDEKTLSKHYTTDVSCVAVDWISRRVYWTNQVNNTVEVMSLDNPTAHTELINFAKSIPRQIAIDPLRDKLYVVRFNEDDFIEWSNLDGTERQVLIEFPQIRDVKEIRVLLATGELCYTDYDAGKIECINPTTKHIRTIVSNIDEPWGLAITDETLYWTTEKTKMLESVDMVNLQRKFIPLPLESSQSVLTAVSDECPFYTSPCAIDNGGCPENTICLVNAHAPMGKNCTPINSTSK